MTQEKYTLVIIHGNDENFLLYMQGVILIGLTLLIKINFC